MIEQLYERYHAELVGWCTAMTNNAALAQDLVQEAFLRALRNEGLLQTLKDSQRRSWLYRTVKNLYLDKRRHDTFETVMEVLPERNAAAVEYTETLYEMLLEKLPEEERRLFTMRYLEGYNATELGKIFAMSPATVRSKLSSARKNVKKIWEEG